MIHRAVRGGCTARAANLLISWIWSGCVSGRANCLISWIWSVLAGERRLGTPGRSGVVHRHQGWLNLLIWGTLIVCFWGFVIILIESVGWNDRVFTEVWNEGRLIGLSRSTLPTVSGTRAMRVRARDSMSTTVATTWRWQHWTGRTPLAMRRWRH